MLSGNVIIPRDFAGYSDKSFVDFVEPMMAVQNVVSCHLFDLYGRGLFSVANITCNRQ